MTGLVAYFPKHAAIYPAANPQLVSSLDASKQSPDFVTPPGDTTHAVLSTTAHIHISTVKTPKDSGVCPVFGTRAVTIRIEPLVFAASCTNFFFRASARV